MMNISSNQLEAFYAVARSLSFSKGAALIHVTQSAVSQRISALEENLGTSLFIRDRAKMKLTPTGEKLLRYCQSYEQNENELLSELKVTDVKSKSLSLSGEIRIGGFSSISRSAIVPALAPLLQKHPEVGFTLVTKELTDLLSILKSGEVDFIITNKIPKNHNLEAISLGYEENVLVQSKKYKNSNLFLDHDSEDVTTSSYFRLLKKAQHNEIYKIKRRYVDDVYGLIDGVRFGLGQAVLPKHLIIDEKDFTIVSPQTILKVPLYLSFYKQSYYGKLHSAVVDAIGEYFKRHF